MSTEKEIAEKLVDLYAAFDEFAGSVEDMAADDFDVHVHILRAAAANAFQNGISLDDILAEASEEVSEAQRLGA